MVYLNSTLAQNYDASLEDLKVIQMHKLVIGNYSLFISTYGISIVAACYGVTKFYRLGHARITKKIFTWKFMYVFLVSTIFFATKGLALAGIVTGNENPLADNVGMWALFTMAPTTVMVLFFTLCLPCIRLYKELGQFRPQIVVQMILKQPCLLLAPHITPFFFTLDDGDIKFGETLHKTDGKKHEYLRTYSCHGSYSLSPNLTVINSGISMIFTLSIFSWKSQWVSNFWHVFFVVAIESFLFLVVGIWGYKTINGLYKGQMICIEHGKKSCIDCMKIYGFSMDGLKSMGVEGTCLDHYDAPYEYKTELRICNLCSSKISFR